MRTFSLLFTLLFFAVAAGAQSQIPEALNKAFADRFPNAKYVEWEDEEDGIYEVVFEQDDKNMTAKFEANGNWLETEVEIDEDDLPEVIKRAISTQFSDFEIDMAETVSTPERALAFEVLLDQDDLTLKVLFDTNGKVLEKEEVAED